MLPISASTSFWFQHVSAPSCGTKLVSLAPTVVGPSDHLICSWQSGVVKLPS